ncbi:DUF4221 family protein [Algoriphagus resistens]|uniref:DUF4221 family protein n=1 Tax=Algoriphagus resistens TaxID=1750590 RepID=UPI0007169EED|nr:DUF4221 family protein [Algoriphagus resistens]
MRKPLLFICLTLFFSCSQSDRADNPKSENILENLTYSINTVLVDTGNEILDFSFRYNISPSPDSRFFYFLNKLKIQKIDLDHLNLVNSFSLEKDGPNSPGPTVGFYALSNGDFFFPNLQSPSIISGQGLKTKSWNLDKEDLVDSFPVEPSSIGNRIILDPKRRDLYSLPMNFETRDYYFAVIDSLGKRKKMVELTEFKWANKYLIKSDGEQKAQSITLQQLNELALISCSVGNETYSYAPSLDSLFYRKFPHEFVPSEKTGEVKNRVGNRVEFEEELKKLTHKISYWSFLWDDKSERYFRFASRAIDFDPDGWATGFEIFLIAYSEDLELIGETRVNGLSRIPFGAFFRDGKLYSNVNVEDELGFAVFTFNL